MTNEQPMVQPKLDQVVMRARERLPSSDADLFVKFIRLYYSQTCHNELISRDLDHLYEIAHSHWQLFKQRTRGELAVRVHNPDFSLSGLHSKHTVLEIAADDMPFIVDSVAMELNRLGYTIHLMIHMGGMKVVRDDRGEITDILPYTADHPEVCVESPVYMELDRQTIPGVLEQIADNVTRVLSDVKVVVEDWAPMQARLRQCIDIISSDAMKRTKVEESESTAFLTWLLNDHFIFLGAREYEKFGEGVDEGMKLIPGSSLGVLRDESKSRLVRKFSDLPLPARRMSRSKKQTIVITKTNTLSTVHRNTYTDAIIVKLFDAEGELVKEIRFIGLFTSTAYNTDPKAVPFLRRKVAEIFSKSGLPEKSHAGKDLMHILATFPRDDLFHATTDELFPIVMGILHLQERRHTRLFTRLDSFGRYISCLVFMPADSFNTDVLLNMMNILKKTFNGIEVMVNTLFSSSILVRIHYIVRIDPEEKLSFDEAVLEQELIKISCSWYDGFREAVRKYFGEERGNQIFQKYKNAFPAGYRENFSPEKSVYDIEQIEDLVSGAALGMSFYRPKGVNRKLISFKLFRSDQTVSLSDALPMLENMGLRVLGEQPYQLSFEDGSQIWINDFSMTYTKEPSFEVEEVKNIFQEAFNKVWQFDAENDGFNRLVLEAQLNWREIAMLRAYSKYLKQVGFTFSTEYIAQALVNHPEITHRIVDLFKYRFDPAQAGTVDEAIAKTKDSLLSKLDDVAVLDEDKILRRFLDVVNATVRTNYYQVDSLGYPKSYLSFKVNPAVLPGLPLPLPKYEIFVYSPRFEGVHLRADKVARGGIRWSDRREDFRTEVLGLMKAQVVKNAIIVPAGAKGGFVPKCLPLDATREEILEEGIACYKGFIQGLLDLTDNIKGQRVISPQNTVSYDGHDTYLVVAADKGTATFSDIANSISQEHQFWLADAFASGGSVGYDHKKMGITARGAWVSVERHFQELGINISETPFTVIGVGDMSGDVFGNGMLLSKTIRLVAAFNHQHIFVDPDPNIVRSYEERQRIFNLPRSSWLDYNAELISRGGGIFSRSRKSIPISPEMKTLFGITKDAMVPNDLIQAILKAPVDLLWNGGIGTYVKSKDESHLEVGDRANDAVRVNGCELQARVIGEGGNLGLTQLGRIEFEQSGGRVNTDFIDNSAGVDCSDNEVNIKILLNQEVAAGRLTEIQRNTLLASMTDDVAHLVLEDNYNQNKAISLEAYISANQIPLYMRYINHHEKEGRINRELEFLPSDKTLLERRAQGVGLTRPEIAVLFAYSKIIIENKIRESDIPEDPYLSQYVRDAFPQEIQKQYGDQLNKHRLYREIVSTLLSNRLVSNMGLTFNFQLHDEMAVPTEAVVRAYTVAQKIFSMEEIFADIEALDYRVDAVIQFQMMDEIVRLIRRATRWFLRNRRDHIDIAQTIESFMPDVAGLSRRIPKLLLGDDKVRLEERRDALVNVSVPNDLALKIANIAPMYHALNIIEAANSMNVDVYHVAKIYFILVDRLDLLWFRDQINQFVSDSRWTVLAKAACKGDLDLIQRELTIGVLNLETKSKTIMPRINAWFKQNQTLIDRWESILSDIRATPTKDFEVFSVALRGLSDLAKSTIDK